MKLRNQRAADDAADIFYADQIKELKAAWMDGGQAGFIDKLNEMHALNSDLTESMLKMHEALDTLTKDEIENTEAVRLFAEMEEYARLKAQERTKELMAQAEKEREMEIARKNNYEVAIKALEASYRSGGENGLASMWEYLGDTMTNEITKQYPQ